jgi:hypothetical protein
VDNGDAARVAAVVLDGFERSEFEPGGATRIRLAHAGRDVLAGELLDVQGELLLHLGLRTRRPQQRVETMESDPGEAHEGLLCVIEQQLHSGRKPLPDSELSIELLSPLARERVELRRAAEIGILPLRCDPSLMFQTMKGRVEGALADGEGNVRF